MAIAADEPYRPLLQELAEISELVEKRDLEGARDKALALEAACAARGLRSAHVLWNLAIVRDYLGDFEMAFQSIREALDLDPVAPPLWQSYRIIVERMQRTLADPERPADDPVRPRLYALLAAANEVTLPCHLAMARYQRSVGKPQEAVRLLEAVTLLHPAWVPGWRELAVAARTAGHPELAERAETQAIALGGERTEAFSPVLTRAQA